MKKNRIYVAGNILVDHLYPINGYPERGQLTVIADGIAAERRASETSPMRKAPFPLR